MDTLSAKTILTIESYDILSTLNAHNNLVPSLSINAPFIILTTLKAQINVMLTVPTYLLYNKETQWMSLSMYSSTSRAQKYPLMALEQ